MTADLEGVQELMGACYHSVPLHVSCSDTEEQFFFILKRRKLFRTWLEDGLKISLLKLTSLISERAGRGDDGRPGGRAGVDGGVLPLCPSPRVL